MYFFPLIRCEVSQSHCILYITNEHVGIGQNIETGVTVTCCLYLPAEKLSGPRTAGVVLVVGGNSLIMSSVFPLKIFFGVGSFANCSIRFLFEVGPSIFI